MTIHEHVYNCTMKAWEWVSRKYSLTAQMDYTIRAVRFPNARFARIWYSKKKIRILYNERMWCTYCRKRAGLYSNRIACSETECIMLQSIHELTHLAQHLLRKKYSEVETTKNEFEYAKEHFPHLYRQLIPVSEVPKVIYDYKNDKIKLAAPVIFRGQIYPCPE